MLNLTIYFYKLNLLGNLTFKKIIQARLSQEDKEVNLRIQTSISGTHLHGKH